MSNQIAKDITMNTNTISGFMRALRFIFGALAIVQGIANHDIVLGALGLAVSGMALFNVGCCGANGCATNSKFSKKDTQEVTDIDYTEVK